MNKKDTWPTRSGGPANTGLPVVGVGSSDCLLGLDEAIGFPAVYLGYIGIEGAGALAETGLVDLKVEDLLGDALCLLLVSRYSVKNVMCAVMVRQLASDVEAISVPFVVLLGGQEYVSDLTSEDTVALSTTFPQSEVGKGDDDAVDRLVEVGSLVRKGRVDDLCPFGVTDLEAFVFKKLSLLSLVLGSCLFIKKGFAAPDYLSHSYGGLDCCLIVDARLAGHIVNK